MTPQEEIAHYRRYLPWFEQKLREAKTPHAVELWSKCLRARETRISRMVERHLEETGEGL